MQQTLPSPDKPRRNGIDPKWWILSVTALGSCMSALDGSVVNVALPVIQAATGSTISAVGWVVLIYLIIVSASVLLFGRLSDIYGKRWIYLWGLMVFMFASLLCGLSRSIGWLILARGIQGIGSAMVYALGPAILVATFPESERGRALGIQATTTYLGLFIGPGLGGFLTQHLGWSSIFFINLPIGVLMLIVAFRYLHFDEKPDRQPFDPAGVFTMGLAMVSLLLVLTQGKEWGWMHPGVWACGGVCVVSTILFIRLEQRCAHPALDLSLFRIRLFSMSVLVAFFCYVSWASIGFLMPFYLLNAAGYSPSQAGGLLMAVPLTMMATASVSGFLADRVGTRFPTTLGMGLMALGIGMLGRLTLEDSAGSIAMSLAWMGVGVGLFGAANNSALMGSVPKNRQGVAGAVLAGARSVGFAIGVAMASLVYVSQLAAIKGAETPEAIAQAIRFALRITLIFAVVGTVCSLFRGRGKKKRDES